MARTSRSSSKNRWRPWIGAVVVVSATTIGMAAAAMGSTTADGAAEAPDHSAALIAEEAALVAGTQRLYDAWGLEFPDASIRFHSDSTEPCKGAAGLYRRPAEGPATVDVCYPGADPEIGHIMRANVLWHEVGHAYIEPRTNEATKASLLDLLDLRAWTGGDWDRLGAEYAAEILVWGMMGGQNGLMVPELDCETKSTGFTILTGLAGPRC